MKQREVPFLVPRLSTVTDGSSARCPRRGKGTSAADRSRCGRPTRPRVYGRVRRQVRCRCFGCNGLGCASGEDAFWPRNRVFWLLLDSEWLSAGDPWQSQMDPECADRVVLPVAYQDAAFGTGRPRSAAWSPGERRLGTRLGPGSAVGRPRVYRDGPPSEGLSRRCTGRGSMAAERGWRCANRAYPRFGFA